MEWWILVAAAWLLLACAVSLQVGRSIRHADQEARRGERRLLNFVVDPDAPVLPRRCGRRPAGRRMTRTTQIAAQPTGGDRQVGDGGRPPSAQRGGKPRPRRAGGDEGGHLSGTE